MPPKICQSCNAPMIVVSVDKNGNKKWKCTDPLHVFNVTLRRRVGQKARRKRERDEAYKDSLKSTRKRRKRNEGS